MTTSASRPIRRSAWRATGSMDQPTSCPCVLATTRRMPALRRRCGPSSASGAAAPNQTVDAPCARASRAARRATPGTGSISEVGCRCTGYGAAASNSAAPGQAGA